MSYSDELGPDGLASPEPSQRFHGGVPKLGAPLADFIYRNTSGRDVLHVTRYQRVIDASAPSIDDGLVTRYWTWDIGESKWMMGKGAPRPAPLWQSDSLFSTPDLPVYLFDNEEAASEFHALLMENDVDAIATTWAGGSTTVHNIDLQLLAARGVVLWPSKTSAAQATMLSVAGRVFKLLEESGYTTQFIRVPDDKPNGWNVAQAIKDGWKWRDLEEFIDRQAMTLSEAPQRILTPVPDAPRLTAKPSEAVIRVDVGDDGPRRKRKMLSAIEGSLTQKWREYHLALAPNGLPHAHLYNVGKVIEYHKGAYCDVWMDEFHQKIMTAETNSARAREWTEADTLEFTRFIQDPSGVGMSKAGPRVVHEAIVLAASKNKRNEVREWLNALQWDGVERLNTAFPLAWGTVDSPYYAAVGRCFMMGAAARILFPGCQVDTLPVFEGPEGIFKSSAIMVLASEEWYDSPTYELGEFDFVQSLQGKWILEFAELGNMSGKSGEKQRAVITRRRDTFRASYARMPLTIPRQCVFSATTNDDEWNNAQFGARRFWPVMCSRVDLGMIKELRAQWFAEAVVRVNRGEKWYDVPLEELKIEQARRVPSDLWDGKVLEFVRGFEEVTADQVARGALGLDPVAQTPMVKHRITMILKKSGWYHTRRDGLRVWRPAPGSPSTVTPAIDDLPRDF